MYLLRIKEDTHILIVKFSDLYPKKTEMKCRLVFLHFPAMEQNFVFWLASQFWVIYIIYLEMGVVTYYYQCVFLYFIGFTFLKSWSQKWWVCICMWNWEMPCLRLWGNPTFPELGHSVKLQKHRLLFQGNGNVRISRGWLMVDNGFGHPPPWLMTHDH